MIWVIEAEEEDDKVLIDDLDDVYFLIRGCT